MKRKVSEDVVTRSDQVWHQDGEEVVLESRQDIEPVLKENEILRKEDSGRFGKGPFHHVGSIPNVVWFSLPDHIKNDDEALREWLNKPENEVFRTKRRGVRI